MYDEQDGDFLFTRSKRQKTMPKNPPLPAAPEPDTEPEPAPAPVAKKSKSKASTAKKRASSPAGPDDEAPKAKRPTRRKRDSSPAVPNEPLILPKKRPGRKSTRSSTDKAAEEAPTEEVASKSRTPRAKSAQGDDADKTSGRTLRKKAEQPAPEASQATPEVVEQPLEKDPNATKITLPFSDTPINNRNKEFRKKGGGGGGGGRRSSMSMRGRRASSLIESGHSAIPHHEVDTSEFFKHIEAEGLSEPRRMRQLLTWCGERALSEKPKIGTVGANAVLGGRSRPSLCDDAIFGPRCADLSIAARAIQDQLLKDFGEKSEFSDWFSREDEPSAPSAPKREIVIRPNPINMEHDSKISALETRIKR